MGDWPTRKTYSRRFYGQLMLILCISIWVLAVIFVGFMLAAGFLRHTPATVNSTLLFFFLIFTSISFFFLSLFPSLSFTFKSIFVFVGPSPFLSPFAIFTYLLLFLSIAISIFAWHSMITCIYLVKFHVIFP